jgi:hypothetical protein
MSEVVPTNTSTKKSFRNPKQSPLDTASCCNLLFWRWLTNFLYFNWAHRDETNPLLLEDIWPVPKDTECDRLSKDFLKRWSSTINTNQNQRNDNDVSGQNLKSKRLRPPNSGKRLAKLLITFFWRRWLLAGCCYIFWCICALLQPEIVAWAATYLSNTSQPSTPADLFFAKHSLLLPLLLFVCGIGYALSINVKFHILVRIGIQMKGMIQSVLIRKALRLHVSTKHSGMGAWTNLVR